MIYVYLGIALFILAAGGAVVWKYNHALEEASAARQELAVAKEAIKAYEASYNTLRSKYDNLDESLKRKAQNDAKLRKQIISLQGQLEELKQRDPVVKDWADQRVPEPIVNLLRDDVPAANKGDRGSSGTKGVDLTNPGSNGGSVTIRPN